MKNRLKKVLPYILLVLVIITSLVSGYKIGESMQARTTKEWKINHNTVSQELMERRLLCRLYSENLSTCRLKFMEQWKRANTCEQAFGMIMEEAKKYKQ